MLRTLRFGWIVTALAVGCAALSCVASLPWAERALASSVPIVAAPSTDEVKGQLQKLYPLSAFSGIGNSELPGVYTVYANGQLFYFAPAQHILIFGEMYDTSGRSHTQNERIAHQSQAIASIDFSSGIVIGTGSRHLIEFVDPDCGHCRRAHEWFSAQPLADVQKVLIFMARSESARQRAKQVICAAPGERRAALNQLWRATRPVVAADCKEADDLLAQHARVAAEAGVTGTPTYIVKGQVVQGFAPESLLALLSIGDSQ